MLLVIPDGDSALSFVKAPPGFALCIIQGKKCGQVSDLLTEFARALDFPDYFGHNWDALEECLADFDWLPAKGISSSSQTHTPCFPMMKTSMTHCWKSSATQAKRGVRDKQLTVGGPHFMVCSSCPNKTNPSGNAGS